jgi:uncharacterized membrane protein YhfC
MNPDVDLSVYQRPWQTVLFLGISGAIAIAFPILLFLVLRRKCQLRGLPLVVGITLYFAFVLMLQNILNSFVVPEAWKVSNPAVFVVYSLLIGAVFVETGRLVGFWMLKQKYKDYGSIGTPLAVGIGFAGIESILVTGLFSSLQSFTTSNAINNGMMSKILEATPEVGKAETLVTIQTLMDTPSMNYLYPGIHSVIAVVFGIGLSLLIWHAMSRPGQLKYYGLALVLNILGGLGTAMMQVDVIDSYLAVEVYSAVIAVVTLLIGLQLHKKDRQAAGTLELN